MDRLEVNCMEKLFQKPHIKGFVPYALAAFLVGLVGGFTSLFSPAFVEELNLPYNNTTWTALAMAMSSAAFAPVLGKLGDVAGRRFTLLMGIAVFTVGNVLTATAPSLIFMLIARFITGIGTAAIAPVVISYIVTEFPPDKIAKRFCSLYVHIGHFGNLRTDCRRIDYKILRLAENDMGLCRNLGGCSHPLYPD